MAVVQDSAGQEKADAPRAEGVQGVAETEPAEEVEEALPRAEDFPPWPVMPDVDIVHSEEPIAVTELLEPRSGSVYGRHRELIVPGFVAIVRIEHQPRESGLNLSPEQNYEQTTLRLLASEPGSRMSAEQRRFVGIARWLQVESRVTGGPCQEYVLYAVSRPDAELMVQAFMEAFLAKRRKAYEELRQSLTSWRQALDTIEMEIETELLATRDEAARREQLRAGTTYQSADDAKADIVALTEKLRDVEIDIAGIEAMRAAIGQVKANHKSPEMQQRLDQMLIEQDMRLAGALARKELTQSYIERAEQLWRFAEKYSEVTANLKSRRASRDTYKGQVGAIASRLANPEKHLGRLPPIERTVVIRPVQAPERVAAPAESGG